MTRDEIVAALRCIPRLAMIKRRIAINARFARRRRLTRNWQYSSEGENCITAIAKRYYLPPLT